MHRGGGLGLFPVELNLNVIDFSNNSLTGSIPEEFGKMIKLGSLALFMNQLSGKIPVGIGRLQALSSIELFMNNLSGELPPDFDRFSKLNVFYVSTNYLTGSLPDVGPLTELLINLLTVKLWCCISCEESNLLVYEYMANRSLDLWLHTKKRSLGQFLDWPTRLKIAIGTAQGLCMEVVKEEVMAVHGCHVAGNIILLVDGRGTTWEEREVVEDSDNDNNDGDSDDKMTVSDVFIDDNDDEDAGSILELGSEHIKLTFDDQSILELGSEHIESS
nr:receptor-like protein kinase 5 isoform X3 [Ipomoea trifida]